MLIEKIKKNMLSVKHHDPDAPATVLAQVVEFVGAYKDHVAIWIKVPGSQDKDFVILHEDEILSVTGNGAIVFTDGKSKDHQSDGRDVQPPEEADEDGGDDIDDLFVGRGGRNTTRLAALGFATWMEFTKTASEKFQQALQSKQAPHLMLPSVCEELGVKRDFLLCRLRVYQAIMRIRATNRPAADKLEAAFERSPLQAYKFMLLNPKYGLSE